MLNSDQNSNPLPIKKGVNASCLFLSDGDWRTVFEFFCYSFPHISIDACKRRFDNGEVKFENGEAITESTPYQKHKKIYYYRELESEEMIPFEEKIVFENERILVLDKPHFLPIAPSGDYLHETLIVRIRNKLQLDELELCHRLDRETAGLVLVTKKQKYRAAYHKLFSDHQIKKVYHAVSVLPPTNLIFPLTKKSRLIKSSPFFLMKEADNSDHDVLYNSESKIEVIDTGGKAALYKLTPKTGKKHQLRVHMASLGLPIKNDSFYPNLLPQKERSFEKPLQLLAKSIHFQDPFDKKKYDFHSSFELAL